MYHRRLVLSGVLATVAAASTALCKPNKTSSALPDQPDVFSAPIFSRQPGPVSITMPATLPPRPSHLHPVLAVCIVRHGARTPVQRLTGQSPAEFAELWGQCHPVDAQVGKEIDPGAPQGRESEAPPEALPRTQSAPKDEEVTVPCGTGQLTVKGEQQLREVGAMLRRQYVDQDALVPPTFTPAALAIRSSNITRTRLSAVRLIQGMYPGTPLATVRALINVMSERDEDLYPMYRYCPRLRELFHSTLQHPLYQRYIDSDALAPFHQSADRLLSSAPFDPQQQPGNARKRSWIALSDEIKCRQGEGLPLPTGMNDQMASRINRLAEFLFHSLIKAGEHDTEEREAEVLAMLNDRNSIYNENARLGIGRFVQTALLPVFQSTAATSSSSSTETNAKSSSPRLHVYACHDSSVIAIMNALGMDASMNGQWPPFASWIVMEVLTDKVRKDQQQQRYVRVVYNGKQAAMVEYDEWIKRMENVRVDYDNECKPHSKTEVPPQYW